MSSKKRHRGRRTKKSLTPLEPLFLGLKEALIHDMDVDITFHSDLRTREPEHPDFEGCTPYRFKCMQQALTFDKRVIWSSDKPFEKLSEEALKGFKESQEEFLLPEPLSQRGSRVTQRAMEICHKILGEFSYDAWFDSCSFGKRAALGLPRSKCYLDTRFERLNGTYLQWTAFNHALSRDMHLHRAVRERLTSRVEVSAIKATTVPKSYKAARVIAPDTVLGGFLSRGLGDYIRKRLEKETHIDLAFQQDRHRRWAQNASKHGHLATIDMSKASDSFTWRHIELLVPEDWHQALDCVRTRQCDVDGEVTNLKSYMLMGSGHTFPLQTLLFYCLAEATRTLLESEGKVSVYGDDIIIPTKISAAFIVVMNELGFVINSEKSFFDEPDMLRPSHTFFRESCGGDYKGGVDVRPYMPECDLMRNATVPRNEYVAWCHKLINGLLDRWDTCEIPVSLGFLLSEINSKDRRICFVPAYETDHAGIRHYIPPYHLIGRECSYIAYECSMPTYYRLVLNRTKRERGAKERPYLWLAYFLQRTNAADSGDPLINFLATLMCGRESKQGSDPYATNVALGGEVRRDREGVFRWKKKEHKRLN